MHHLFSMGEVQCCGDLLDDVNSSLRRNTVHVRRECAGGRVAADETHADPQHAVLGAAVVDGDDDEMVEPGDGVGLPPETGDERRLRPPPGARSTPIPGLAWPS